MSVTSRLSVTWAERKFPRPKPVVVDGVGGTIVSIVWMSAVTSYGPLPVTTMGAETRGPRATSKAARRVTLLPVFATAESSGPTKLSKRALTGA